MTDTTPLPWKVSEGSDQYICNGDSWIASTMGIRGEQGAANARYIVQAVNSHARLVEALMPFTFMDEDGPKDTQALWEMIYNDRVQDWFSYEDFENARATLSEVPHG